MQKIEAIIFDLGGVILDIDYNLTRNAFEKLGAKDFNEMYSQAEADKLFKDLEKGYINEADFYSEFNKCTRLSLTPHQISEAWNAMLLTFREKSLLFLKEIKSRYRLFLLSNTNAIHYYKFDKIYNQSKRAHSFEEYFERVYYSFEMGKRKPDDEIYRHVLEENNLLAASTLFIDDSLQNVDAAKNLGIQIIHLKPGINIENTGL